VITAPKTKKTGLGLGLREWSRLCACIMTHAGTGAEDAIENDIKKSADCTKGKTDDNDDNDNEQWRNICYQ
jgi:hypothetical protein